MLGKRPSSMKKLATKVKTIHNAGALSSHYECLLEERGGGGTSPPASATMTPPGSFVMYVGEDQQRFTVPADYLSHPLFRILLDKSHNEFGFSQRDGLVVPCRAVSLHSKKS